MADLSKDVVGARISLDTTKILPAFKVIDNGARANAESFKILNSELGLSEKNFKSLVNSADKFALSAEDRRKKILAESETLVKQRTAQAELNIARKNQLDQANKITDEKLRAQQAIVKKREDAIEQQEREHLKRMEALQNKATLTGQRVANFSGAGTDDRTRERVLMEEQSIRMKLSQLAEKEAQQARKNAQDYEKFWVNALRTREQKEAQVREKVLQEEQKIRRSLSQTEAQMKQTFNTTPNWMSRVGDMATHALVFNTAYAAMHKAQQALEEGLIGIESNMAGYIQTNEHYFLEYNEGTKEMAMNTEKLHDQTTKFIRTAHDLGSEIMDVTESARLWGRMYKDAGVVQEMVRKSTMLSTVDLVSLEGATKSMESTFAQYGVQIKDSNDAMVLGGRVLDSWSKVAHDTMAPAKDLGAAFERTGKIAAETGVSFDFMNGLISAGVRNTALSGENLGNMWKTVLGTIRTDKAVGEIERLGVATKEVVNGSEQWRKAEDILLDLSTKVIDKNYDLTKSYADISRGVYQYAKLAASLNAGDILLGTAASIGSTGSTMEYLKVQMDTIQRKAAQTKASLLEIFNNAGDDGLRRTIKDVLDAIDQLLIGLTKVPPGVFEGTAAIGGLLLAYKALSGPIMNVIAAVKVLTTAKAAETAAIGANTVANNVNIVSSQGATLSTVQRVAATEGATLAQGALTVATEGATVATRSLSTAQAMATVTTAAATAGLSLLIGAIAMVAMKSGDAEKAARDRAQSLKDEDAASQQMVSQYHRQIDLLPKLVNAHRSLEQSLKLSSGSVEKEAQVKKQLEEVSKALVITLGKEGAEQLEAAGYTDEAVQVQVNALNKLIEKQNEARKNVLRDQQSDLLDQQRQKVEEITETTEELQRVRGIINDKSVNWLGVGEFKEDAANLEEKIKSLEQENNKLTLSITEVGVALGQATVETDQFAGKAGTAAESAKVQEEALADLREQIQGNGTAVSEMNNILSDLSKGQSMNAAAATDLILKYPQLAAEIYKTSDGWKFEKDAVEVLRKAKIQKAIDDLKSEKASAFNTKVSTDERLKAYSIEAEAIKNLAQLKAALNGVMAQSSLEVAKRQTELNSMTGIRSVLNAPFQNQLDVDKKKLDNKKKLDEIYTEYENQAKSFDTRINALSKLYKDPKFGVSDSSSKEKKGKKGKSDAEKSAEARKDSYSDDMDNFKYIAERNEWAIDQQIAGYKRLGQRHKQYLTEDKDAMKQWVRDVQKLNDSRYEEDVANLEKKNERMRQANKQEIEMTKSSLDFYTKEQKKAYLLPANRRDIQKQIYDLTVKYNELRYQNSEKWIDKETSKMEMAGQSQIAILKMEYDAYMRMSKDKDRTSEQSFELQQKIYEKRKALEDEFLSDFQKRINYQKSMEAISVSDQLSAWTKMQALYKEGSEQRMEIDVLVHDLKKQLMDDQQKAAVEAAKKEKELLEKSRDEEVKRIEAERDAFVEAQDAKIKAIDDLLAKMQTANEDEDYDRAMAEKQARLALLQSAVGPEGIAERKQVEKDIEDMQREHNRTLAKRGLEDQKKKLQDEKTEREKDYNDQIEAAKQHYDQLAEKYDEYSDGVESTAEDLKNTQISKESEKNAEILRQLDQFIADYQMKMAEINATSLSASLDTGSSFSQKDSDLERYNSNIDKWYSAGATEKAKLHEENAALRNKYGIKKDTGKLQKFHSGGVVQGDRGAEVPVIARAGEMYLNDQQQSNLFKIINFKMPALNFSMPDFSMPMASGGSNPQQISNQFVIKSGDTYIEDESAAKVFWTERDNLVRRLQARGGKS
ncbi:phage tail tape measure protein [Paenibacillus kribbensis]|uniref:phage tail tape measure protein n=1 Tax=Paenibacillus kribbensis TaxID=172713 RepID=UPI002DBDA97C|nr:phage tail tape measure protein [Paenibacillus kribbensis]MEC0233736.1 phage tail tape measure protein [Paenibacillus kribbensis]